MFNSSVHIYIMGHVSFFRSNQKQKKYAAARLVQALDDIIKHIYTTNISFLRISSLHEDDFKFAFYFG
jgi:uncharacterized protein YukE